MEHIFFNFYFLLIASVLFSSDLKQEQGLDFMGCSNFVSYWQYGGGGFRRDTRVVD